MALDITDLIQELDRSFIPLERHDVYESRGEAHVVVPRMVKELELLEPPTLVHLGYSRVEYEFLKDDGDQPEKEAASTPDGAREPAAEQEAEAGTGDREGADLDAEDTTIPYLVLTKYDRWLREEADHLNHYKQQELKDNRALNLGYFLVPEISTRDTVDAAPKPHQIALGETLTFWVRPRDWRNHNILYILRERYGTLLFDVFQTPVEDLLEPPVIEQTDDGTEARDDTEARAVQEHVTKNESPDDRSDDAGDELIEDGGWRDPETSRDPDTPIDDSPVIEDALDLPAGFEAITEWQDRGYRVDVSTNRAIATEVIHDLLGVSKQVEHLSKDLDTRLGITLDREEVEVDNDEIILGTLRILLEENELDIEELQDRLKDEYPAVPESVWDIRMRGLKSAVLPDWENIGLLEHEQYGPSWTDATIRVEFRPTAIYAAMELVTEGEEADDP